MGLDAYRFSISWTRILPSENIYIYIYSTPFFRLNYNVLFINEINYALINIDRWELKRRDKQRRGEVLQQPY